VDASTRLRRKYVSGNDTDNGESLTGVVPIPRVVLEQRTKMTWEQKSENIWQKYGRHVLVIFVVVLLVHDVFGTHGFLAMRQKQKEIQKVSSVLDKLNKENVLLEQDVQDLKSDPQTIRRIAREELGLAQPGEVIIKLPAPAPQGAEAAKP
jgi:cell division protein FtsL